MVRGGRLSFAQGLIARLLNISPLISLDETGKAIVLDKTFNRKATMERIMAHIRRQINERPIWNYIVMHANNPEAAEWYETRMESLTGKKPVSFVNISPIIGAHSGVGASAIAYMFE